MNVLQRAALASDLYHFQLLTFWFPYVRVLISLNNACSEAILTLTGHAQKY